MTMSSELSVRELASRELRDKDLVTRHVMSDTWDKIRRWTHVVKKIEDCHREYRQDEGIGGHGVRIVISAPQDNEVIEFVFQNNWQSTLDTYVILILSWNLKNCEFLSASCVTLKCVILTALFSLLADNSSDYLFRRFPAFLK